MTEPRADEFERDFDPEMIMDMDVADDVAKDVRGGAYEPNTPVQGQKQGPIKNP